MAARSPGALQRGPDVGRNPTPISLATMPASVVLPRPGGPENRTWSTGSPRPGAPSISRPNCSLTVGCPTNSSSHRGPKRGVEVPLLLGLLRRDHADQVLALRVALHGRLTVPRSEGPREGAPRPGGRRRARATARASRASCGRQAQRQEGLADLGDRPGAPTPRPGAEPVLEVEDDPRRHLLPHARDPCKRGGVARAIARRSVSGGERREDRHGHLRPDPGHGHEVVEQAPLVGRGEPVEHHRVLAHLQPGEQARGATLRREGRERLARSRSPHSRRRRPRSRPGRRPSRRGSPRGARSSGRLPHQGPQARLL